MLFRLRIACDRFQRLCDLRVAVQGVQVVIYFVGQVVRGRALALMLFDDGAQSILQTHLTQLARAFTKNVSRIVITHRGRLSTITVFAGATFHKWSSHVHLAQAHVDKPRWFEFRVVSRVPFLLALRLRDRPHLS